MTDYKRRMIIKLPAQLISVIDKVDRSCKLTFNTRELKNQEFINLREIRGLEGILAYGFKEIRLDAKEVENVEKYIDGKSPSQRLRAVLYRNWEKDKEGLTFEVYYAAKMEKIIDHYKNLLD